MTGLRFRVQTRTHGEPWRTQSSEGEFAVAEHRAAGLVEQRDLNGHTIHPYVRIQHGGYVVALWQYGQKVITDPAVAS